MIDRFHLISSTERSSAAFNATFIERPHDEVLGWKNMFRKLTTRERRTEPGDRGRRRGASKEFFANPNHIVCIYIYMFLLFFHSSFFEQLLSRNRSCQESSFGRGGGACPQGYPVPAFRFTRELDRAKCRTCVSTSLKGCKVQRLM